MMYSYILLIIMEPKYDNYIATPEGNIYFNSGSLKDIQISEGQPILYVNVDFLDVKQFEKFVNCYTWDFIWVKMEVNGLFMYIGDPDKVYGLPTFKIYTDK